MIAANSPTCDDMTDTLYLHPDNPQVRFIRQAVTAMRGGAVIAYPTDSSYAFGWCLEDKGAMEKVARLRGVDKHHHYTLVCRDLAEIARYARVENWKYRLLKLGTPGPFTFLLEATKEVPRRLMNEKRRTIGIRVPDHPVVQMLLTELGEPMMSSTLLLPGEDIPLNDATEIADRLIKRGGPALLFENVKGSKMPVLINAFGSDRRMEIVLGGEKPDEVAGRIGGLLHMAPPDGLMDKLKMLPRLFELGAFIPKKVNKGPAQEVVRERDFSLRELPVLQCWPDDAGRFITFPLVFSRDPRSGKRNCGMYRMQVYDDRTTGMHWQTHKQGAEHFRRAAQQGEAGQIGRAHV